MNEIEQIPLRNSIDYQRDSSALNFDQIKEFFLENLIDKWKYLARELDVNENDIDLISKENLTLKQKFSFVRSRDFLVSPNSFFTLNRFWILWLKHVIIIFVKYSLICSRVSSNANECYIIVNNREKKRSFLFNIIILVDQLREMIAPFYSDLE